jgi:hypothetical protein
LKRISIPRSAEAIGPSCFSGCKSLVDVQFAPDCSLKAIATGAFSCSGIQRDPHPGECRNFWAFLFGFGKSLRSARFEPIVS